MVNTRDMMHLVKKVLDGLAAGGKQPGMDSPDAAWLVFRTGAVESGYKHLRQKLSKERIGVARSFWQIEPWVARSIINNYIDYRPSIKRDVEKVCMCDLSLLDDPDEEDQLRLQLMGNMLLGIALCRLKYRPVPKPIPDAQDIIGQAEYWLRYYNAGGKGTIQKFVKAVAELPHIRHNTV